MRLRGRTKLFYLFLILVVMISLQGAGEFIMQNSTSKLSFSGLARQLNGDWKDDDKRDEARVVGQKFQGAVSTSKFTAYPYATSPTTTTTRPIHYLPRPNKTTLLLQEILSSSWVAQLHERLKCLPVQRTKQVSIVFSDFGIEVMLNWLIASQVRLLSPLRNLVVVCLDEDIFHILNSREIPSILVDSTLVLKPNSSAMVLKPGVPSGKDNSFVSTLKLVVCRLVNYFGYDVVSYDTDAIPLRNLQPVFEKYSRSDVIGSVGSHPQDLKRAWGFTMSMAVVFFRSSANMGEHQTFLRVKIFLN